MFLLKNIKNVTCTHFVIYFYYYYINVILSDNFAPNNTESKLTVQFI